VHVHRNWRAHAPHDPRHIYNKRHHPPPSLYCMDKHQRSRSISAISTRRHRWLVATVVFLAVFSSCLLSLYIRLARSYNRCLTGTVSQVDSGSDSGDVANVQERKQTHGVSCVTCIDFLDHLSSCRYKGDIVRRNQPIECSIVYM
jgi:hypothetical protein